VDFSAASKGDYHHITAINKKKQFDLSPRSPPPTFLNITHESKIYRQTKGHYTSLTAKIDFSKKKFVERTTVPITIITNLLDSINTKKNAFITKSHITHQGTLDGSCQEIFKINPMECEIKFETQAKTNQIFEYAKKSEILTNGDGLGERPRNQKS
jgi:hypothetical protein